MRLALCGLGLTLLAVVCGLVLHRFVSELRTSCGALAGPILMRAAVLCLLVSGVLILSGGMLLLRQTKRHRDLADEQERYLMLSRISGTFLFEYSFQRGKVVLSGDLPERLDSPADDAADFLQACCHPEDLPLMEELCRNPPPAGGEARAECRLRRADGRYVWYQCKVMTLTDSRGRPERLLGCLVNISERKEREADLLARSSRDSLTGLLNKRAFAAEVDGMLREGRCPDGGGALLVIDLDNFKEVNDTCGHSAGDGSLLLTARVLRETFAAPALVGRAGGDEFVAFLPGAHGAAALRQRAGELCRSLSARGREAGPVRGLTCSVGAAVSPENGTTFAALFDAADAAMYRAKRSGKNTCAVCGRGLDRETG